MKLFIRFLALIVCLLMGAMLWFGCGGDPSNPQSPEKSSVLVLKATTKQDPSSTLDLVPVGGGTVKITSALLNLSEFALEGGRNDDDEDDDDHGEMEDDDDEDELEIEVRGPLTVDISNGEAFIDSVAVFPGRFTEMEMEFAARSDAPFDGNAIVIKGEFTPDNGTAIPFTLRSKFSGEIETLLAGDGIVIDENAAVPVVINFDLAGFLRNVDFGSAEVVNGEITIDGSMNSALLSAFEANLSEHVELDDDDEDDEDEDHDDDRH